MKKTDKIFLRDNDDTLQIIIEMKSIIPCLRSIQQYKPQFKPQDIIKEKHFNSRILDNITEYLNDYLYGLIDDSTSYGIKAETTEKDTDITLETMEFEPLEVDFTELKL